MDSETVKHIAGYIAKSVASLGICAVAVVFGIYGGEKSFGCGAGVVILGLLFVWAAPAFFEMISSASSGCEREKIKIKDIDPEVVRAKIDLIESLIESLADKERAQKTLKEIFECETGKKADSQMMMEFMREKHGVAALEELGLNDPSILDLPIKDFAMRFFAEIERRPS